MTISGLRSYPSLSEAAKREYVLIPFPVSLHTNKMFILYSDLKTVIAKLPGSALAKTGLNRKGSRG